MHSPDISGDILAALRHATAAQHEILDSSLPLARPDASLDDYVSHLQMLHAWLAPIATWQARFDDGPQGPAAPPPLERLASIETDLRLAGAAPLDHPQTDWPSAASVAYRWGVAYVVEGSQLGGAVLYKRLAAQLAPHPLGYLRSDSAGPGPRWRAFSAALREQVRNPAAIADACAGASAAFARILALRVPAPN